MKNIIFLGAPGSGKGTQSAYLIRDFGLVQISTGDILRASVKEGTPLGKLAQKYMSEGALVPDDVIVGVMEDRLKEPDCANGCILDGFPRTIPQAEALEKMFKESLKSEVTCIVSLEVPDDVVYERLTGRRSCPTCGKVYHTVYNPPKELCKCDNDHSELIIREDDKRETIEKRLNVYHNTTTLLKPYYEKTGRLLSVDGMQNPDNIYAKIKEFIAKFN